MAHLSLANQSSLRIRWNIIDYYADYVDAIHWKVGSRVKNTGIILVNIPSWDLVFWQEHIATERVKFYWSTLQGARVIFFWEYV